MMNRTFNIFNSTKELEKLMKKSDIFLYGRFIKKNENHLIHIKSVDELQRTLSGLDIHECEVFLEEVDNKKIGAIVNFKNKDFNPIRFIFVPKFKKFLKSLDELRDENSVKDMNLEDLTKLFYKNYYIDLGKIIDEVQEKVIKRHSQGWKQVNYLECLTFNIEDDTNRIPMVKIEGIVLSNYFLNFVRQDDLIRRLTSEVVLFSTEQLNAVYEDTNDMEIVEECLAESNQELYELLGKPDFVSIHGINLDWMNSSGYKVTRNTDTLLSQCIPSYDSTTELYYNPEERDISVAIYSHDCPTGSILSFSTISEEVYEELR